MAVIVRMIYITQLEKNKIQGLNKWSSYDNQGDFEEGNATKNY